MNKVIKRIAIVMAFAISLTLTSCIKKCIITETETKLESGEQTITYSCRDTEGGMYVLINGKVQTKEEIKTNIELQHISDSGNDLFLNLKSLCNSLDGDETEAYGYKWSTTTTYESGLCDY